MFSPEAQAIPPERARSSIGGSNVADSPEEMPGISTHAVPARRTRWQRFKLVAKVIEVRLRFVAVLVVTGLVIGYWDTLKNHWDRWTRRPNAAVIVQSGTELYCPMHPSVVRPGLEPNGEIPKCPICGMPLSLRRKGEAAPLAANVTGRVQLTPERIELAGVKTEEIAYKLLAKAIVTVGSVQYDETRLSRIVSRVNGYLEKLHVSETFVDVKEGEPLAEIYSPELYVAARELIVTVQSKSPPELVRAARERLRLLGVDEREIDESLASGDASTRLLIRSPQHGHVIQRNVVRGAYVATGSTLFEVADLTKVWIEAEVFERDIPFLRKGQPIEATLEAFPNRTFAGTVALVHPHLDPGTRTNVARFTLENPSHELRPGMYATVTLRTPLGEIEPWKTLLAADAARVGSSARAEGDVFACPMHGEALALAPGKCPRCGLALERKEVARDHRTIWWCPMHQDVRATAPGAKCDRCGGMVLVPRVVPVSKPGEILAVPEQAVIDTGSRKVVYVERESGLFEGVLVELGPRVGAFYPVVGGLRAGDRVASEGSFLIDAETRLNPAAASTYVGASGGPSSSGKEPAPPSAASPKLDAPPAAPRSRAIDVDKWTGLSADDKRAAEAQGTCPISGEPLGSMGTPAKLVVQGHAVFLCCRGCEEKALADPTATLRKAGGR